MRRRDLIKVIAGSIATWPLAARAQSARDANNSSMAKAIRKQIYDLTPADFHSAPVWEFTSDEEGVMGQDEATVRPYELSGPPDTGHGGLVIRAVFKLADGTTLRGYLSPQPVALRQSGYVQPVIICDAGQVNFWSGMRRPTRDEMTDVLAKLGKEAAQVFPVEYRSDVELIGGPIAGTIPGFGFIENKTDMFVGPDGISRAYRDSQSR
jgi:hypothetical protein